MDPRRVADGSGHTATRAVLMEETLIRNTLTINGACWEFLKSGIFVATIQPETPQAP